VAQFFVVTSKRGDAWQLCGKSSVAPVCR